MSRKIFFPFVTAFFFLGMISPAQVKARMLPHEWLGLWSKKLTEGTLYEKWEKTDDSTMTGTDFFITGKDTIQLEKTELCFNNGSLIYRAASPEPDNGPRPRFLLHEIKAGVITFRNEQEASPHFISYDTSVTGELAVRTTDDLNSSDKTTETRFTKEK